MSIRQLIIDLGGPGRVAACLGRTAKAVGMWAARNSIPADCLVPIWLMATEAGIEWAPPGADGAQISPPADDAPPSEQAA